jgi:hypothetical protein
MRYIAAAALHQKALKILSVIEDAEAKMAHFKHLKDLRSKTTFRNELDLWPCGMPNFAPILHNESITEAAHKRLCKCYDNILSRLIDLQ